METIDITPKNEIKNNENTLNEFQKSALEQAEKDLEAIKTEIVEKRYTVDVEKNDIVNLKNYIIKDAPWKFTECLGIVEVEKSMAIAIKNEKLALGAVELEAIYYYLSKVEGFGKTPETENSFKSVEDYIRVLKSITILMEDLKSDGERLRKAEFVAAARREGIDPETTDVSVDGPQM